MLEENNMKELTYTVAWLNCCSVNYLAGWIGVMILALYLCIDYALMRQSWSTRISIVYDRLLNEVDYKQNVSNTRE